MSADSQQIDITPYKVRRENVINSGQSKTWESKPNDDLASSILNKLTEIRGNLYPTHLNIPPHKSGPLPSATSPGYSHVSTSLTPQETGTFASGIDSLLKKDIYDYTSELSKSRDQSPSALSSTSSYLDPSYSNTRFENTTFKNMETSHKTAAEATIPRIELNFATNSYLDPTSFTTKPSNYASVPLGINIQPAADFSPQANSHVNKNAFHISSGYEPQKNSLDSTYANSRMQISESLKASSNNLQEQSSSNQMFIPIARNASLSPDSTQNNLESKSNPTSTRATQTKVHISATARLPSVGKPASRTQLINSLNEALKCGHNDTTTSDATGFVQHKRLEKSMDVPKKQVGGPKALMKPKNKSTVMLANIIAQNQGLESKRFSFGQLNSEVSDSAQQSQRSVQQTERSAQQSERSAQQSEGTIQQSERSEYSQRDKEIQDYINSVSKNQVIRAEALKKRSQNPASSTALENRLHQVIQEKEKNQANANKILILDDQVKNKGVQKQSQRDAKQAFPQENQATEVTAQNKFQRDSRKTLSLENPGKELTNQFERQKRKTLPQNNDYEEVTSLHQSQRNNVNFQDSEEQSPASINKSSNSRRASPFEDETAQVRTGRTAHGEKIIAKPHLEGLQYENKSKQALHSDFQSERTKSHTAAATRSQLEDEFGQISIRNESQIGKTRSRPMTRTQFDNLPYEDSSSQIAIQNDLQSERTKSRPMTRSQLDDETRDSGHEPLQKNPESRSGSSSPARSHTTEIIVAKKLDYQQNKNADSPIRVREINAQSGRGSVIERSGYSESQERQTENKKMAMISDSYVSSNRPVSVDSPDRNQARASFRTRRENQERNVDSNDEYGATRNHDSESQPLKRSNIDQNSNSANSNINYAQRNQRSQEMMNFSPVRQNLGMLGSPQASGLNMLQSPNQLPADFRMQMPASFNMQMQIPNLENDPHHAEHQKHIMMVMNYYENHLNNMKNVIFQQNETINQERYKAQMAERKNMEMTKTIQSLEQTIKDQSITLESTQRELKTRYEIVMDELASLKRTMLTHQITENPVISKAYSTEGKEYQGLLYHEILSLRKDMENQRSIMHDFRSSTRHLEDQMKDLEKMYIDELRSNSAINNKRELLRENLDSFKKDYLKVDTLNQVLFDGYERAKKDLDSMRGQNQESVEDVGQQSRGRNVSSDFQQTQQKARRDIYIGSPSPSKYENNQEMLRNKMRAEDSQMKNLLQWNSKNESNNVHFVSHNYTQSTKGPQTTTNAQQQFFFANSSQNGYAEKRGYSPQQNQGIMKKVPITDHKANRSHVVFPTYQKMESHREQVKRIDQTILELSQHKKFVENELFKMPSVAKSLEQKRKKAGLEMELEGVDNQIEECKNQLRKYDVLNVK